MNAKMRWFAIVVKTIMVIAPQSDRCTLLLHEIAEQYTMRHLTYASGILRAISALAREYVYPLILQA